VFQEFNGRLSQPGFPHQMLLSRNPPDEDHWLATEEFRIGPELKTFGSRGGAIHAVVPRHGEVLKGRRYYTVPIYANAHNLSAATIETLEASAVRLWAIRSSRSCRARRDATTRRKTPCPS